MKNYKIKEILDKLWVLKNGDRFYFDTYGKAMLKHLSESKEEKPTEKSVDGIKQILFEAIEERNHNKGKIVADFLQQHKD